MMKMTTAAAVAVLASSTAFACDDRNGTCKIEDYASKYIDVMETLRIDGVTTCDTGKVHLRLYDGEKLIGVETAFIQGHTFTSFTTQVERPAELTVKYSIR